ncbi:TPA: PQQ-binding-like beta-propeller repeat protein [Candidatus Bathyarchaeota archaeon]|nr:PQQ-binding-like beta-propeller repeat protein [Candidatus Bathyarchaeota archaeon]HIJ07746.1 PQQ-binding-like beta-propeller repeat protein [Candidatus Bathyarchaeota archaeon]
MQKTKNRTTASAIGIITLLVLSISVSMTFLPSASAHTPPMQLATNAYIVALPDPIGVGQQTLIYMWLNRVFGQYPSGETPGIIAYAAVNNDYRFHNYKLTITAPDGTVTTQTFETIWDTTSNQGYRFTPTQPGTYQLKFEFPGQNVNDYSHHPQSVMVNDTYLPSSATATLTVQQDPIFSYPDSYPLPNEYWARPIFGENPSWWSISSNWLGTGAPGYQGISSSYNLGGNGQIWYAGDTVGPQTSHIMWTHPLESGGIVGGNKFEIQGNQYFEGSAYNQRYQNPIIVNGRIYYNEPISFTGSNMGPLVCQDLRTGNVLWSRADLPQISFALIWDHEDPNQHGVFPAILATSNFGRLFDAETGTALFNVTGVPSGSAVMGPMGEHIRYVLQNLGTTANPNYVIAQWNSTKLWNFGTNPYTNGSLLSPAVINASYLGNTAVQILHSVPLSPLTGGSGTRSTGQSGSIPVGSAVVVNGGVNNASDPQNRFDFSFPAAWRNTMSPAPTIVGSIYNDIMILQNGTLPSQGATFMGQLSSAPYTYFAVNLNPAKGQIGSILWMRTYDPPPNDATVLLAGFDPVNRVFVENLREEQRFVGYSMDTGEKLWTTAPPQPDMDYYGSQASGSLTNTFAYGKLYSSAYAGIVYCYDTKTGNTLWTYGNGGPGNNTNSGFQAPGHYPTFINGIGNDIVYLITSEHTVETPVFKGAMTRAINATTGAEIWTLSSYVTEFTTASFAIADGFATWFNSYDNSIYVVGRGPSAVTVQAPLAAIELGRSIVITGTVRDLSAGSTQSEQAARFGNGLPVSSDESMTDWMAYVYQQKPLPMTFKGVEVSLNVVDSNGNYRNIGTATTDASGMFSYHWKPDIEGKYTVIASFLGTEGYWPSYAETAFAVDPAASTPVQPEQPPPSIADLYFLPAIAGVIAAIIIVGIVIVLMLRKR